MRLKSIFLGQNHIKKTEWTDFEGWHKFGAGKVNNTGQ